MNVWNEPYPENLEQLLGKAKELAVDVKKNFASNKTKQLKEFYLNINGKVRRQATLFNDLGFVSNTKNNKLNEFRGLYLFGEEVNGITEPVYVGISRTVYRRLRQHGWGKNHNESTLAYLIANEKHFDSKFNKSRNQFPQDYLDVAKTKVKSYKVVLLPVENDYELYFLEVTLAVLLKTKWNSFRTH